MLTAQAVDAAATRQRSRCATDEAEKISGGYAEGVTPVPIPNTEVKSLRADDTARVAVWESRSPPELINKRPVRLEPDGAFAFETKERF